MSTSKKYSPSSARKHRIGWEGDKPPEQFRVTLEEAVALAGNKNKLARVLGITRSAVYQWYPPYRMDKYIPIISAMKLLSIDAMREQLQIMRTRGQ